MKLAIIGSRFLCDIIIDAYIPSNVSEIVSGGAKGIDLLAKNYASRKGIAYTEFLPNYKLYGRGAPIKRNEEIARYADKCIAFWDGSSKGTEYTVNFFKKLEKQVTVIIFPQKNEQS